VNTERIIRSALDGDPSAFNAATKDCARRDDHKQGIELLRASFEQGRNPIRYLPKSGDVTFSSCGIELPWDHRKSVLFAIKCIRRVEMVKEMEAAHVLNEVYERIMQISLHYAENGKRVPDMDVSGLGEIPSFLANMRQWAPDGGDVLGQLSWIFSRERDSYACTAMHFDMLCRAVSCLVDSVALAREVFPSLVPGLCQDLEASKAEYLLGSGVTFKESNAVRLEAQRAEEKAQLDILARIVFGVN